MRLRGSRGKLLIEPPSVATGDIAFNLLIFFLVCASAQPDTGRKQVIPRSEQKEEKLQSENIEVSLTRTAATVNGNPIRETDFQSTLKKALTGKKRPEDRVVVVKSAKDVPYDHWIKYTGMIEAAGGVITLQLEESRSVIVN